MIGKLFTANVSLYNY